jgi:hypothetical protein
MSYYRFWIFQGFRFLDPFHNFNFCNILHNHMFEKLEKPNL